MLSEKLVARNLKKWGFATHAERVRAALESALIAFVKKSAKRAQRGGRVVLPAEWFGEDSGRYSTTAAPGSSLAPGAEWTRSPLAASDDQWRTSGGQRGGRIVHSAEWYGGESGRYSADAAPGSSLEPSAEWIREPLGARDLTGAIVGGGRARKQRGGRIAHSAEWYGGESGRYSGDAAPGSSLAPGAAWIREPLAARDLTGAIVGGAAARRFAITLKAVDQAAAAAYVKLSKDQTRALKSQFESLATAVIDSAAANARAGHLSYATFEAALRQKKHSKLY